MITIVGQNGVTKSSFLDVIRGVFVKHIYSMPHSLSTVLVEINGETKVLSYNFELYLEVDIGDDVEYIELEKIETEKYQILY